MCISGSEVFGPRWTPLSMWKKLVWMRESEWVRREGGMECGEREGEGKGEKEEVRIGWKEGQLGNRRRERRRKRI